MGLPQPAQYPVESISPAGLCHARQAVQLDQDLSELGERRVGHVVEHVPLAVLDIHLEDHSLFLGMTVGLDQRRQAFQLWIGRG